MKIDLERVGDSLDPITFRVAFHSAAERCLLPYPCVTGLKFRNPSGGAAAPWLTRHLVAAPLDDFVLIPRGRIAFDLHVNIDMKSIQYPWILELTSGEYDVQYHYEVDRETDWYDFLAKRSRFVATTPIWRGEIQSNVVRFKLPEAGE